MTKITQIEDRGATTVWSPILSLADVIALGTKDSGGIGFEDTGSELELYDLNLSKNEGTKEHTLLGTVKTEERFASLDWSASTDAFPFGLIAGGMENGVVNVWDAKKIIDGSAQAALLASFSDHASGAIKAVQFNKLHPMQLATGGSDGKVLIINLDPASANGSGSLESTATVFVPCEGKQQTSQITSIAWNTQVAHVVASAATDGTVAVWDLKSRKAWCELRAEQSVSSMAWNPSQGLHLLTASSIDSNPVLKLWDLRSSTSMPLATLVGHNQGVLSLAWCPHDDQLLLSSGKDNRTILWDLFTLKPIGDVPNDAVTTHQDPAAGQDTLFGGGGGLASSQQRRYEVKWSPIKRGVALTCSLDRKVQAHSLLSLASLSGRPPKWLRPSSSVSCAFGGTIVSCGSSDKVIRIRTVVEEPRLAEVSQKFESDLASTNIIQFCIDHSIKSKDPTEAHMWGFMKVIFENNARQQLLDHLGFDPDAIAKAAETYGADATNGVGNLSLEDTKSTLKMPKGAEEIVKKALLVGNFEAAVDCCFRNGNLADALVLASCGGADLWTKTQERFFAQESPKRPYLSTVSAVIHNQLPEMITQSDPNCWQETLAILSTYGKSEEFPELCVALGDLLEKSGDPRSASLCFMCALNLDRAIPFWRSELEAVGTTGSTGLLALHKFVMKVSVFLKAIGPTAHLSGQDADLFSEYAEKLSEQGLFATAAKYSKGEGLASKLLSDRLYRSRASPQCLAAMGGNPPDFPFTMENIQQSRGQVLVDHAAQKLQQQQAQAQQQLQLQQQQAQQALQQEQQAQLNHSQHSASQHSYTSNQPASVVQAPAPAAAPDALPPGWVALQDPSSGSTYYANQTTGEVTWDRPQSAPIAQVSAIDPYTAQPTVQEHSAQARLATKVDNASTPSRLASKYGDGFVTSASHPELASQYGNVGTSNPYSNTVRPGTAAVAGGRPDRAPVSGTLNPEKIAELPEEHHSIRDCLLSLMEAIKQTPMSAVDKRQLGEAEKAVAVLLKRLTRGDIPSDVVAKVNTMTSAIMSYDFRGAQSVQTGLVNSDWKENKDWLKGIKALLQLAAKKFSS